MDPRDALGTCSPLPLARYGRAVPASHHITFHTMYLPKLLPSQGTEGGGHAVAFIVCFYCPHSGHDFLIKQNGMGATGRCSLAPMECGVPSAIQLCGKNV